MLLELGQRACQIPTILRVNIAPSSGFRPWTPAQGFDEVPDPLTQCSRHRRHDMLWLFWKLNKSLQTCTNYVVHANGDESSEALPFNLLISLRDIPVNLVFTG